MDNIMNEQELDTDEEDLIIEEASINNLKNNFTFDDFWDYLPTRAILKNEFRQQFHETLGNKLVSFMRPSAGRHTEHYQIYLPLILTERKVDG